MKKNLVPIVCLVTLLLSLLVGCSGCLDLESPQLSTLAVSTPLPVKTMDYVGAEPDQVAGNYWRIAALVDGSGENYVLTLPAGTKIGTATTQETLKLYFRPINPYWHANCYDEDHLKYYYQTDSWWGPLSPIATADVPYYRVSGSGQTITAGYTATLEDGDGNEIVSDTITNFDTDDPTLGTMTLEADGETIYITLDGTVPSGILPPSGELAVLFDGDDKTADSSYDVVSYISLSNDVDDFEYMCDNGAYPVDWKEAHTNLRTAGLSSEIPRIGVTGYDIEGVGGVTSHPTGVRIYYGIGTFKPMITAYIPEELAETITEEKAAPAPYIQEISDLKTTEGEFAWFKVTVENRGSGGDVQLTASCPALQNIKTMGDSTVYIPAGDSYTWAMTADVADELTSKTEQDYTVTVTANGGVSGQFGSTSTSQFTVTVLDSDQIDPEEMATLTVKALYVSTDEVYENGKIFIGFGSDARAGSGTVTQQITPGIEYPVYGQPTDDYYAQYTEEQPKSVILSEGESRDVIIYYDTKPVEPEDESAISWGMIILALLVLGGLYLLYTSGAYAYLLENPILIATVIIILAIWWGVMEVKEAASTVSDSLIFWK